MKRFVNLPCFLLLSYTTKVLITGASIGDAIGLIALSTLAGWWFYLDENREPDINEKAKADVLKLAQELDLIKSSLSSLKLVNTFGKR